MFTKFGTCACELQNLLVFSLLVYVGTDIMATMHESHCIFLGALPAHTDPSTNLREKQNRVSMAARLKNYAMSLVFSYRRLLISIVRAKEVQEVSWNTCYVITSGRCLYYFIFCEVVL